MIFTPGGPGAFPGEMVVPPGRQP
ncbi:MAG: hypothetical protein QOG28_3071, partial [Trebonia sp.]|nr:hypothetical protein [Trebonia sp.]